MKYWEASVSALRFALHPRHWGALLLVDFVFFCLLAGVFVAGGAATLAAVAGVLVLPALVATVLGAVAALLAVFVLWGLAKVYVEGAVLNQANRHSGVRECARFAAQRYPSLLLTTIVVGIVAGIFSSVPFIGWLLAIVVALFFYTASAEAVVGKRGPIEALQRSVQRFRKRPLETVAVFLVSAVTSAVLTLFFAFPLVIYVLARLATSGLAAGGSDLAAVATLLAVLASSLPALLFTGAVALAGMAVAKAFCLKLQVELVKQR